MFSWVKDLRKQNILFAKSFLRRLHKSRGLREQYPDFFAGALFTTLCPACRPCVEKNSPYKIIDLSLETKQKRGNVFLFIFRCPQNSPQQWQEFESFLWYFPGF
ncbi:hypothetical protein SUGI_1045000 [Cryptomeria japonica]|nr:hypothetical protein SUGI_1045000 [Cryptomeria japonica]